MSVLETTIQKVRGLRYENPIVTKELRTRMRGSKAHWLMLGYVLILGVCAFFSYYEMWTRYAGHSDPTAWMRMRVGFNMFQVLTWAQTIAIALIAPALSSGTITIENEQQTMEMLSMTMLSPRNIIVGKLMSPMLFILMLLGISLPLAGLCLMFGSISPSEMLVTYLLLVGWAFLLSSVGVFFSSCFKKTMWAALMSFGVAGAYTLFLGAFALDRHYGYGAGGWTFIHSAVVPAVGLECALESGPVLGFKLPFAVVALLTNVLIGFLLLSISLTHLKFHRIDKTLLIRGLTLVVVLGEFFLFFGNLHATTVGQYAGPITMLTTKYITLGVLMTILIPLFAVGSLARNTSVSKDLWGWPHRRLVDGRPTGGMWFLALMCICGVAVVVLTSKFAPVPGAHRYSTPVQAVQAYPSHGHVHGHRPPLAAAPKAPRFLQTEAGKSILMVGVPLLAWTIGASALAVLLASVSRTRQVAAVFTFLVLVLFWVIFPSMTSWVMTTPQFYTGWKGIHGLQWNAAYLWPALGIARMSGNWIQGTNAPWLMLSSKLAWFGASFAWFLVGFGAVCLADIKLARRGPLPADAEE